MTSHDLAVPDESRGQQAFCEGISHHFVRAQRHELEESSQDEFTHIVLTNITMKGELSAHLIFSHHNTSKVVLLPKSGLSLRNSKIV